MAVTKFTAIYINKVGKIIEREIPSMNTYKIAEKFAIMLNNPKEWESRKYLNRLKKQRQWTESKATMVAGKERRKEERKQEQFNKDIDTFANLYFNQNYT